MSPNKLAKYYASLNSIMKSSNVLAFQHLLFQTIYSSNRITERIWLMFWFLVTACTLVLGIPLIDGDHYSLDDDRNRNSTPTEEKKNQRSGIVQAADREESGRYLYSNCWAYIILFYFVPVEILNMGTQAEETRGRNSDQIQLFLFPRLSAILLSFIHGWLNLIDTVTDVTDAQLLLAHCWYNTCILYGSGELGESASNHKSSFLSNQELTPG